MCSIKVIVDFNVWQRLIREDERPKREGFQTIYEAISRGVIRPFLSDVCYTEALPKKDRLHTWSQYGSFLHTIENKNGIIHVTASPPPVYKIPDHLIHQFEIAKNLGFKAISTHRIAMPHANIADMHVTSNKENELLIMQRMDEAYSFIRNDLKAGDRFIEEIATRIRKRKKLPYLNWLQALEFLDDTEIDEAQLALSESADGDIVVACYSQ